ncbi:MAG: DUF2156 domain-containing protein [Proteobacteria bacterium]|nr:DUF2156 domain-containing protein [Pseudomonadota bacterium]
MLADYPHSSPLTVELRPLLHPLFQRLSEGISEFTFANLYLFRDTHRYSVTTLDDGTIAFLGRSQTAAFFMLPFSLPAPALLDRLFHDHGMLKCATSAQAQLLAQQGYRVEEDRNNFDYLYRRQDLALLGGRNYHKKRNLIKAFTSSHAFVAKPLRTEMQGDALRVLEDWRQGTDTPGDYRAAREAVELMEPLQLCGGIYYVESRPTAFVLGEELAGGASYAIHFEKAVPGYKGLYQFINQSFAAILPEQYVTINREQDLGDPGLRQAKMSYLPAGFVEKFKVTAS